MSARPARQSATAAQSRLKDHILDLNNYEAETKRSIARTPLAEVVSREVKNQLDVKQHDVKPRKVFRDVQSSLKGVTTPIAGGSFDDPIIFDEDPGTKISDDASRRGEDVKKQELKQRDINQWLVWKPGGTSVRTALSDPSTSNRSTKAERSSSTATSTSTLTLSTISQPTTLSPPASEPTTLKTTTLKPSTSSNAFAFTSSSAPKAKHSLSTAASTSTTTLSSDFLYTLLWKRIDSKLGIQ